MALTRGQIIDAALDILRSYGLADLSMRRLARDLGVQPGALYWHVKNKQELLGVLAERILADVGSPGSEREQAGLVGNDDGGADGTAGGNGGGADGAGNDDADAVRQMAREIRSALLAVRDGADVVSLAQALAPDSLPAIGRLRALLADGNLTERQARWGARTLTHYILGAVAEEQTHAELTAAGLLSEDALLDSNDEAFIFGVDTVLSGLRAGIAEVDS
jgi:AcrR family transcriptional regulator